MWWWRDIKTFWCIEREREAPSIIFAHYHLLFYPDLCNQIYKLKFNFLHVVTWQMLYLFDNLFSYMFVIFRWLVHLVRKCTKLQSWKRSEYYNKRLHCEITLTLHIPGNFHPQIPSLHANHRDSTYRKVTIKNVVLSPDAERK